MKEHTQASIDQAKAFQKRHDPLFSADANDPLRKIIPFGVVEDVSTWANEILDDSKPITFQQEGKNFIVFETPTQQTKIVEMVIFER